MLIVLAPSETKAPGGSGAPIRLDTNHNATDTHPGSLSFPELNPIRASIATDLVALTAGPRERAAAALKVGPKKYDDITATAELMSAPTMPAILRYTGVQYDALEASTLSAAHTHRIAIGSALFGLIRANDMIPFYRLSGGSKIPTPSGDTPTMKARWGTAIRDVLSAIADNELLIDLRSGTYQQLGKVPGALTVRVEAESADGTRSVVSHFNKHYKGQLARVLASAENAATSVDDAAELAARAGFSVERSGPWELTIVVRP